MAIRFDASGDYAYRTSNVPGLTNLTLMGRVYLSADRDAATDFMFSATGGNYLTLGVADDGTTLRAITNNGSTTGTNLTTARWYHVALVKSGTSIIVYLNGASDINRTDAISFTPTAIILSSTGANWLNGRLADVRIWSAALSQSEVQAELAASSPVRTSDLWVFLPMNAGAGRLNDSSGNGYNFTAAGSLADEDGPFSTISPSSIASGEAFGSPTVTQVGSDQTISPSGIASAEAFGTATITPGAVTVSPTGIASAEAFGTATVTRGAVTISPTGIASGETFGTPTVTPGAVTVSPTGITSGEAFGTATVTTGAVTVSPTGIASGEAFGTPTVTTGAVTISPTGIASGEAFGTPVVSQDGAQVISPTGIPSGEAFGSPTVIPGAVTISGAGNIASGEAFGTPIVTRGVVILSPVGIASGEVFGIPTLTVGAVTISPVGIVSAEAFGNPTVMAWTTSVTPEERQTRIEPARRGAAATRQARTAQIERDDDD